MEYVNKYLRNLKPYQAASQKVWRVPARERDGILKLDWNEATRPPAPEVMEALNALLKAPNFFNLYPATYNGELMAALSRYAGLPEENIQYFPSSDSLHEYIARLYVAVGDPVLLLWPSYDNFRAAVEASGARVYYSELGEDFSFDAGRLARDMDQFHPSLVYICNPNNPTGTFIDPQAIEKMLAEYPHVLFLVDEAYGEFAGASANPLVLAHKNLLITHTLSKAFALANVRFGYLVSSAGNVRDISKIRNVKSVTTFAQAAVTAALSNIGYMRDYVGEVVRAREWFAKSVNDAFSPDLSAYPSRGNFVLIRCGDAVRKERLIAGLEERNIFIRDVVSLQACVRVTVGTQAQMGRVMDAMRAILR